MPTFDYYTRDDFPAEAILARAHHHNRMMLEELPDDPPLIPEDALERIRTLPSTARMHVWTLTHEGRIAASTWLGWSELPTNRTAAGIDISVEPELRRQGIGARLMTLAVTRAMRARRTLLFTSSSARVPAGEAFLTRLGFERGLDTHLNQLVLADLDHALLGRWLAAGPERAADYAIEIWDGAIPEHRLEAFAALASVMNSAPRGSLEIEDTVVTAQMIREGDACYFANGSRRLMAVARHEATGELAGFTEIGWNPRRATIVWQYATGVVAAHRNKGLGRWLKAANMRALLRENPTARVVRTGNADMNAPMLAINRQMGFLPLNAETSWQGRASVVAERLEPWRKGAAGKRHAA